MTDQTNVFNTETPNNPQETPASSANANPFADQLKTIVNDKGEPKYDSPEKALEGLRNSQDHIKTLEAERAQDREELQRLREEVSKMGNIEDFVKRVSPPTQTNQEVPTNDTPKGLSEEEVAKLIQGELTASQQKQKEEANLKQVIKALSDKHGDKTSAFIKEVAEKAGTTPKDLEKMARSNPTLALKVLGEERSITQPSSSLPHNTTPTQYQTQNEKPRVEKGKGAARGGLSQAELRDMWRKSAEYTNRRLGV